MDIIEAGQRRRWCDGDSLLGRSMMFTVIDHSVKYPTVNDVWDLISDDGYCDDAPEEVLIMLSDRIA